MTPAQLARIWQWAGLLCLAIALDAWSTLQSGPALFGSAIVEAQNRPLLLILAIVSVALLLILMASVARAHADHRDLRGALWHERLPRAVFPDLDTRDPMARRLVVGTFVVFLVLPLAALVHFWFELSEPAIRCITGGIPHPFDLTAWSDFGFDDPCRIYDPGQAGDDGVAWFPVVQPSVMGLLTLAACVQVLRAVAALLRR